MRSQGECLDRTVKWKEGGGEQVGAAWGEQSGGKKNPATSGRGLDAFNYTNRKSNILSIYDRVTLVCSDLKNLWIILGYQNFDTA